MTEEWKEVVEFEGLYEVSNLGRIRCLPRHRVRGGILTASAAGDGYRKVTLCDKDRHEHRYVHDVVLTAFVGKRRVGQEAAHGNGTRHDNRLENLRWDTRSGNNADKIAHGTLSQGETHGRRKLSLSEVIEIRRSEGTCREIGKRFGVGPMQISRIKTGKNWRMVS